MPFDFLLHSKKFWWNVSELVYLKLYKKGNFVCVWLLKFPKGDVTLMVVASVNVDWNWSATCNCSVSWKANVQNQFQAATQGTELLLSLYIEQKGYH